MLRSLFLSLLILSGALRADSKVMFDFESGTEGFAGKTSTSPTGATSGKSALAIDAKGSKGWDQDLALCQQNQDWSDATELVMDVNVPAASMAGVDFADFIPVFSGPANSWYALAKTKLVPGKIEVKVPADGSKIATPTKFYLVINSGTPLAGPIYVDNIRKRSPGKRRRVSSRRNRRRQSGKRGSGPSAASSTRKPRSGRRHRRRHASLRHCRCR